MNHKGASGQANTSEFAVLTLRGYNGKRGGYMSTELRIIPVRGIGDISPGTDLGVLILEALHQQELTLQQGDILVVTQKIVSKAEGRTVELAEIEPSKFARGIAEQGNKDPRHVEVVLRESKRIVRMSHGVLISETQHGFICANAGVDESNIGGDHVLALLPVDSDASAQQIRAKMQELAKSRQGREQLECAVIISDTWGRA